MSQVKPYKRTDRVAHQIRQIISETAAKSINLSHLGFITFTSVQVSPDFHSAKVFCSILKPHHPVEDIIARLNHDYAKAFRKYLGVELKIKHTPELRFLYDDTLEYAEKLEQILHSLQDPPAKR